MQPKYRGIDNPNNPQCRLTSAPRPYEYYIPQPMYQLTQSPAVKTKGATGRRVGESLAEMVSRRKQQREVANAVT